MIWSKFASVRSATREELFEAVSGEVERDSGSWIRCLPFIFKTDLPSLLRKLEHHRFRIETLSLGAFNLLRIARLATERAKRKEPSFGEFALFSIFPSIWCLCSTSPRSAFRECAYAAIQRAAPQTSLIYVSTNEMETMFDRWAREDQYAVHVVRHSEYNRLASTIHFLRQRKDYKVVFNEVKESNSVLRSLTAVARRGRSVVAEFLVTNGGIIGVKGARISFLVDRLAKEISHIGMLRDSTFSNRERRGSVLHPLRLVFEDQVLGTRAQNSGLVRALASIDKSAVAVFHSNPYLHVMFTDFRDGSSFTLYSGSASDLTIVPSVRASVAAFMSLYRGISEMFAECAVAEVPAEHFGIADFFSGGA